MLMVVGKEGPRNYTAKDTGEVKVYRALHVLNKTDVQGVVGNAVEVISIQDENIFNAIEIGGVYEPVYSVKGRYAKVTGFNKVNA